MKIWTFSRYVPGFSVFVAMLAGCGGSQPPIGARAAMPKRLAITTHADRGTSWMLPEAKGENLLYASDIYELTNLGQVIVFTYPGGRVVGTLTNFINPAGECVDAVGDVWISDGQGLHEYAHGGTEPIANLTSNVQGCSVDPNSGNLAGANTSGSGLFVWKRARGNPTRYAAPNGARLAYCGYDDQGNLFADGTSTYGHLLLVELPKGGKRLRTITLNKKIGSFPRQVQWDGRFIAIQSKWDEGVIYRIQVKGSSGSIIGSSKFNEIRAILGESWIQGGTVIIAYGTRPRRFNFYDLGLWNYPAGGEVYKTIRDGKGAKHGYNAVAVSLAPKT
jgi:hypothetical protein